VTAQFHTALYAHDEMRDLMRALGEAGVEVYVVTASQQHLVEGAIEALGYPVPRERVYGMRLVEEGGRLLPDSVDVARYPLTWRGGKREVIERFLPAAPVLVGGDSDTDFEMLTGFAETELRLVINRHKAGDIQAIFDDERTLLQGRDERQGRFRPARDSLLLEEQDREGAAP
jgi:phosphoserine phosphatase